MKLNEQQLASLSSPRAVKEYLEDQREDIESIIRQNLAVGDIFKREDLQVNASVWCISYLRSIIYSLARLYNLPICTYIMALLD